MSQAGILNIGDIPPPPGSVTDLEGNDSVVVPPNGAGVIHLLGAGSITTSGNAGTSTETISLTGLTAHNILIGEGTTTIGLIAPSTAGYVLTSNGSSADPTFQPASSSGSIMTIDGDVGSVTPSAGVVTITGGTTGLTTSGSGSTLTLTGGLNVAHGGTGNSSQPAYSLVCGGTTTTGPFQAVADVATGQVLVSGGTAALPAFSAFPQVSGLGVGASPGSTAGITFDGSNFMNAYSTGTWTPTIIGATTAGTTTYTGQNGYYTKIGNIVFCYAFIQISAATGTGNVVLGGLPFTVKNQTNGYATGSLYWGGNVGWTFPVGTTALSVLANANGTIANIYGYGSNVAGANLQMANASLSMAYSIMFQV
jgi:hypothetical protein